MTFYDEMQGAASELLFQQGAVLLKRVTVSPPPNDWTPGEETTETWPLKATAKRLHQRYENGVLIVETGDMVMFAVPEVEPVLTDLLVIDGADRAITNLTPVPAAGTPVLWRLGVLREVRPRQTDGAMLLLSGNDARDDARRQVDQ